MNGFKGNDRAGAMMRSNRRGRRLRPDVRRPNKPGLILKSNFFR